jgi:CheY-like chemotaxis protein
MRAQPAYPACGEVHGSSGERQFLGNLATRLDAADNQHRSLAEFMRELLSGWGMEAKAMHSPREALEAFSADPQAYDLVITDLAMPGTTGFALAREMLARRPDLPVILYTGHIDPIAQRELESAGIRALLPKPIEPDQLHGLIKTLLP